MIIFLYGEDTFRSRKKLNELKGKFVKDVDSGDSSLSVLDGERVEFEKINNALGASSLFSKKRMLVIEKLFANKSKTVIDSSYEYVKIKKLSEVDDIILIFWEDRASQPKLGSKLWRMLKSEKYVQEFKLLSNTEAANWVKSEAGKNGASITLQSALKLVGLVGSDLWSLNNELQKLIAFKGAKQDSLVAGGSVEIVDDDINRLVRGQVDENIFALTDAIGNKNKALALKLFEQEIEAGIAEVQIMHMIVRQFRILLQIRSALDEGLTQKKILNQLKLHPFVLQKGMAQARNYELTKLKEIFFELVLIDSQIKTGKQDVLTAISLMIAKI